MSKKTIMKAMSSRILPVIVLAATAVFFIFCRGRFQTKFLIIEHEDGFVDLRNYDFSSEVYHLVNNWDCFPGKLYTPEDFKDPEKAPVPNNDISRDPPLGTFRMRFKARPETYLTLCSFSVDFSTRVFVNGKEVRNIGFVSDDPSRFVPKVRYMTVPLYSGENGEIEIIYQYSNFVHKDGGFVQSTYISTPENIDEYERGITMYSLLIGSGLMFLMFWFLLCASIQRSWEYAALAFCCLVIALRNQFFFAEYLIDPGYNFFWEYRVIVMDASLIPFSALYLLDAFFPKMVSRKLIALQSGVFLILGALHWIVDTKDLVDLCHICYYVCIPFLAWSIFDLIRYLLRQHKPELPDVVALGAVSLFIVMLIREGISTGSNSTVTHFGITPIVMVICVMLLAVVINGRIQRQMLALEKERHKNQLLEQVNEMNRDFLRMVAHELKTPLTVISGYAQLTERQMVRNGISEKTPERLKTITNEANRLGEIVTKLMDYTYNDVREVEMTAVDVKQLLNSAVAVMNPVCAKHSNTLKIINGCESRIKGNFELLLQVLINLIVNASKHTREGVICVTTSENATNAVFTVQDNGQGIAPEAVPHIFEKGYTTGGGNGLGLAICKETVELHGGILELVSTSPEGTEFRFSIPKSEA